MADVYLRSSIDYLRLTVILGILLLMSVFVITGDSIPWFLLSSISLSILASVNYVDIRRGHDNGWKTYALFLLFAMICGTIGDFLMAGLIYITMEPLINGILLFGIGHLFYLLGLRNRSPLLLRKPDQGGREVISRNLVAWITCVFIILILFYFTIFNPSMLELSIGALVYGILLVSVLAFSITKWNDRFSYSFKAAIILGFLLFIFSDWLLAYHYFTDALFLSGPYVGITYAFGQLLIQLSPFLGSRKQ
jgi:uncharacterized membrane protein YhhN